MYMYATVIFDGIERAVISLNNVYATVYAHICTYMYKKNKISRMNIAREGIRSFGFSSLKVMERYGM